MSVHLQKSTVGFEYPVYFTSYLFGVHNLDLVEAVARKEPGRQHRIFTVVTALWPRRGPREWRDHSQVPLFRRDLGPLLSTHDYLRDVLGLLIREDWSGHLEVAIHTWDVLPEEYRVRTSSPPWPANSTW